MLLFKNYLIGIIVIVLYLLITIIPEKPKLINPYNFSKVVYDTNGKLLQLTISSDEKYRVWTPLNEIPNSVIQSTLQYEDKYFYYHPGVNPISLIKSVYNFLLPWRFRTGGSTLTMQLTRIRFGLNTKSFIGKLTQIYKALELELFYSKREILEAYLNLAPYGDNVEGIGAASLVYFHKRPKDLLLGEGVALTVIPQNPSKRAPSKNRKEFIEAKSKAYTNWILYNSSNLNVKKELSMPLAFFNKKNLPFVAPHFVDTIIKKNENDLSINSSLDLDIQNIVEEEVRKYIETSRNIGILNASVLLVDTRSMKVKALIGSADYFNKKIQGQVNGVFAERSPGSALKPFIYALAMDQGLIHPSSILKDTPSSFSSYTPENFDRRYMGPVSATEALVRSRNIPALELENQLKDNDLYSLLKKINIRNLKSKEYYGLALVLGGVEVTLEKLVSLYAMLANQGVYRDINWSNELFPLPENLKESKILISPEAAFLTLKMLKSNPRPDSEYLSESINQNNDNDRRIAWKTGTSYGFRDAWAIGDIGHFTLGVWIGNFNGESNPAFVGREAAGQLLFQISESLFARNQVNNDYTLKIPKKIKKIKVCSISGALPGPYCKHVKESWFIAGVSPINQCEIHREIKINMDSGLRICEDEYKDLKNIETLKKVKTEIYEFWPSDLLKLFNIAGIIRKQPPSFETGCKIFNQSGLKPEIVSPQKGITYQIRLKEAQLINSGIQEDVLSKYSQLKESVIPFKANTDLDVKKVFWFVNEQLVGSSDPTENLLWQPKKGNYIVRVIDDQGRSSSREIKIQIQE